HRASSVVSAGGGGVRGGVSGIGVASITLMCTMLHSTPSARADGRWLRLCGAVCCFADQHGLMTRAEFPVNNSRTRWMATAATSAILLAGCSGGGTTEQDAGGGASGEPAAGGTVHMLQDADFSYLDPARGFDGGVNSFYRLVYRGLTMQAAGDAEDPN